MKKENSLALGIAFGVAIGTAIGVATDNLGLWLSLGIAIGAAIGTAFTQKNKKADEGKSWFAILRRCRKISWYNIVADLFSNISK